MKEVGKNMPCQYKETSLGGLAVNSKDGRDTEIPTTCAICMQKRKLFGRK